MTIAAVASSPVVAQLHRGVGLLNLALGFLCLAAPTIGDQVGLGLTLLLAMALFAGAGLMFGVARLLDPRPRGAFATLSDSIGQRGARRLAIN